MVRGTVFAIHRSAMHDGPGIRTTVFLKGCPLRCAWCHNPESQRAKIEQAVVPDAHGVCETVGWRMSVEQVFAVVSLDEAFYRASGGGMTLSGGEPTFQADFCEALLREARARGIPTVLDTSGAFSRSVWERIHPFVDRYLLDFKAADEARHRALTGISNRVPLERLQDIERAGGRVTLRCPLVPDVNDADDHFCALGSLVRAHPCIDAVEFLPYHAHGEHKRERFGLPPAPVSLRTPEPRDLERWRRLIADTPILHADVSALR